ncbi:hypothetical protein SDJN03_11180, partial [Cucurbita argyrosperma subsp. sororia]
MHFLNYSKSILEPDRILDDHVTNQIDAFTGLKHKLLPHQSSAASKAPQSTTVLNESFDPNLWTIHGESHNLFLNGQRSLAFLRPPKPTVSCENQWRDDSVVKEETVVKDRLCDPFFRREWNSNNPLDSGFLSEYGGFVLVVVGGKRNVAV